MVQLTIEGKTIYLRKSAIIGLGPIVDKLNGENRRWLYLISGDNILIADSDTNTEKVLKILVTENTSYLTDKPLLRMNV